MHDLCRVLSSSGSSQTSPAQVVADGQATEAGIYAIERMPHTEEVGEASLVPYNACYGGCCCCRCCCCCCCSTSNTTSKLIKQVPVITSNTSSTATTTTTAVTLLRTLTMALCIATSVPLLGPPNVLVKSCSTVVFSSPFAVCTAQEPGTGHTPIQNIKGLGAQIASTFRSCGAPGSLSTRPSERRYQSASFYRAARAWGFGKKGLDAYRWSRTSADMSRLALFDSLLRKSTWSEVCI